MLEVGAVKVVVGVVTHTKFQWKCMSVWKVNFCILILMILSFAHQKKLLNCRGSAQTHLPFSGELARIRWSTTVGLNLKKGVEIKILHPPPVFGANFFNPPSFKIPNVRKDPNSKPWHQSSETRVFTSNPKSNIPTFSENLDISDFRKKVCSEKRFAPKNLTSSKISQTFERFEQYHNLEKHYDFLFCSGLNQQWDERLPACLLKRSNVFW